MKKFEFLKAYFSPFKPLAIKLYLGKTKYGTPYFLPRVWKNKPDKSGSYAVPKKIGFDFVSLGYKTKWSHDDFRFEWNPIWSFVFFGYQFCIHFVAPYCDHYWECYLFYYYETDKKLTKIQRINDCIKRNPCVWISHHDGIEERIDYYKLILKNKYL